MEGGVGLTTNLYELWLVLLLWVDEFIHSAVISKAMHEQNLLQYGTDTEQY